MKSLKESLLRDIDDTLEDGDIAVKDVIKKHFNFFDVDIAKNTITLTFNADSAHSKSEYQSPAILKEIPGNEKIIVKDSNLLYVQSGVSDKTLKRLVSKQPLLIIFKDTLIDKKAAEHSELKNCIIEADMVEFYYPVSFKNCTIKLNSKFIDFKNDTLKSIDDLKGLKLDSLNYNGVVLNIINTTLGKEIYLNKDDDKYMEKIYNVLASVFSEMIKKNRQYSFKIRVGKDWHVTYSSRNDYWYCAYGY